MNKLLKRLKNETFERSKHSDSVKYDRSLKILQLVDLRISKKITQETMAHQSKVSLATVKRFESLQCDSLLLFNTYKGILKL